MNIPWWIGTIVGSTGLSIVLFISASKPITLYNMIYPLIPLFISNLGFWYGFQKAPKFIVCWVFGVAVNAVFGFLLSYYMFDKSINKYNVIAYILITMGSYLLLKK